jgi:hypothetical protein
MGDGNCEPVGSAFFTIWDALFALASGLLIYSSFRQA